jgi:hypothetical protein
MRSCEQEQNKAVGRARRAQGSLQRAGQALGGLWQLAVGSVSFRGRS